MQSNAIDGVTMAKFRKIGLCHSNITTLVHVPVLTCSADPLNLLPLPRIYKAFFQPV